MCQYLCIALAFGLSWKIQRNGNWEKLYAFKLHAFQIERQFSRKSFPKSTSKWNKQKSVSITIRDVLLENPRKWFIQTFSNVVKINGFVNNKSSMPEIPTNDFVLFFQIRSYQRKSSLKLAIVVQQAKNIQKNWNENKFK